MRNKFIVWERNFTYQDFTDKLTSTEKEVLFNLFKYMTEDNLVYLYQQVSQRNKRSTIGQIADNMNVDKKTVQNKLSAILKKQDMERYFIQRIDSGIKGEYLVSPELSVKSEEDYENIYTYVLPKLEAQARKNS